MKCRICGKTAVIKLKSHHTAFCEEDFIKFFERRVERTIKRYRMFNKHDRILVAVSGGKDSLTLLYLLNKMGYRVKGYHIVLGIDEYSESSVKVIENFSKKFGIEVVFDNVKRVLGRSISELRSRFRSICSVCGSVKRYMINRAAMEFDVVATGHNLDDEASRLLGNLLHWHHGYIEKQKPVLEEREGFKRKVKPFLFNSEYEIAAYSFISGIEYVYKACPFSKQASTKFYKKILNEIEEEMPGTKMMFLKGFYEFKNKYKISESMSELKKCRVCGFPSYGEVCSICKLKEKMLLS